MHPFLWLMITVSVISVVYLTTLLTVLTSRREDWLIRRWITIDQTKWDRSFNSKILQKILRLCVTQNLLNHWSDIDVILWRGQTSDGNVLNSLWDHSDMAGAKKIRIFKLFGKTCLSLFIIIYWKRAFKFETLINY